jgi:hypothetical protein
MQARAVFEAAVQVQKEGVKVHPEVMIPLVGFLPPDDPREWLNRARSNLALAKKTARDVYLEDLCFDAQQAAEKTRRIPHLVGAGRGRDGHQCERSLRRNRVCDHLELRQPSNGHGPL